MDGDGDGERAAPTNAARQAYERGDFARVRELLAGAPDAEAAPLRRATSVDPVHAAIVAVCALGLLVIALRYGS